MVGDSLSSLCGAIHTHCSKNGGLVDVFVSEADVGNT